MTTHEPSGTGRYSTGTVLDELPADLAQIERTADLVVTLADTMDALALPLKPEGAAELGRRAGRLWKEITGRGVEFR